MNRAIVHTVKRNASAVRRVSYLANKKTLVGDWCGKDVRLNAVLLMENHHENNLDYIMSNKAFTKGLKKRGISEGREAGGWYWKDIKLPGRVYALPKAA